MIDPNVTLMTICDTPIIEYKIKTGMQSIAEQTNDIQIKHVRITMNFKNLSTIKPPF
jgi:hypothetical protein